MKRPPQVNACVLGTACRTHWQLEQRRVFSAYVESEAWKGELQGPSIRCSVSLQTGPIDIWQTTNNTALTDPGPTTSQGP